MDVISLVADIYGQVGRTEQSFDANDITMAIRNAQSQLLNDLVYGVRSRQKGAMQPPEMRDGAFTSKLLAPFYVPFGPIPASGTGNFTIVGDDVTRLDYLMATYASGKTSLCDTINLTQKGYRDTSSTLLVGPTEAYPSLCIMGNNQWQVSPAPTQVQGIYIKGYTDVVFTFDDTKPYKLSPSIDTLLWTEEARPFLLSTACKTLGISVRDFPLAAAVAQAALT